MSNYGDIEVRAIAPIKVISICKKTNEAEIAEEVKKAFNMAGGKLLVSGGRQTGPKFVLFHSEGGYAAEKMEIELCVPVAGMSKPPIDYELKTIDGHKSAAVLRHKGPYNKDMRPAYEALFAWLKEKNMTPSGPIREVYLHEAFLTPPDLQETEIICPL